MGIASQFARLRSYWVPTEDMRAETWALGARHRGRVIAGTRLEAAEPGITFRRTVLLSAVIRRHRGSAAGKAELERDHG